MAVIPKPQYFLLNPLKMKVYTSITSRLLHFQSIVVVYRGKIMIFFNKIYGPDCVRHYIYIKKGINHKFHN